MPITLNGDTGITTPTYGGTDTSEYLVPVTAFKNRIINGAMMIDQRNAGASVTTTSFGQYTVDRWKTAITQASKFSTQQNAGSVTPPAGFRTYVGVTSLSAYSVLATDLFALEQDIEGFNTADLGFGTANASTVTLSFWVRSSLTGTFGGSLSNVDVNRSYPFTYTISSANTWELKTITIAGDTTGTWSGSTNSIGMRLYLSLGAGSNYSGTSGSWASSWITQPTGATSVVGTNGATFYITGVQLEKGSTATSFDYRPYGTELALCQRYFYAVASGNGLLVNQGSNYSATQMNTSISFPVTMRTTPSVYQVTGVDYYKFERNSASDTFNSFTIFYPSTTGCQLYNNTEISGTAGQAGIVSTNNAASYLALQAEL